VRSQNDDVDKKGPNHKNKKEVLGRTNHHIENSMTNSSSVAVLVAYVFVATGMCLPSSWLGMMGGINTCRQQDSLISLLIFFSK
jgi:hypothetical protein